MDKPDLTLYLGGTRSGKSARAEARVLERADGPVLYVATAETRPDDPSMGERIRRHRARRPENWRTLECPLHPGERIAAALAEHGAGEGFPAQGSASEAVGTPTVLLDCVTLWVSNILFSLPDPEDLIAFEDAVRHEVEALIGVIRSSGCRWVVVSGETGLGGIDPTRLGRNYCDGLGLANQLIAAHAREAFLVVAGRLLRLEA